jgi:hypothetical protein
MSITMFSESNNLEIGPTVDSTNFVSENYYQKKVQNLIFEARNCHHSKENPVLDLE